MNTGIYTWFWVSGLKSLPNFLPMWPPGHTGQLVTDFCRSPSLKLSFRSICRPPNPSVHCGQWLMFKFIRSSVGMTEVYGHPCPSLRKRAYCSCACWMGLLDTNGLKVSVYLKCPCSSSILSAVPYRESVHGDHNFTVAMVLVGVTVAHLKPTQFCLQSTKAKVIFDPVHRDALHNSSVYPVSVYKRFKISAPFLKDLHPLTVSPSLYWQKFEKSPEVNENIGWLKIERRHSILVIWKERCISNIFSNNSFYFPSYIL